jgi:hypothetical protein
MTTRFYAVPKGGTGAFDDPIRASYIYDLEVMAKPRGGLSYQRVFDDPVTPNSASGQVVIRVTSDVARVFTDLEASSGVSLLGDTPEGARTAIRGSLDLKLQRISADYPEDTELDRILRPRTEPLKKPRGTNTTDFTDNDGTLWSALSNHPLTKVHISGTDGRSTFDVLSNEGQAVGDTAGGSYSSHDIWHQTSESAEDQTVTLVNSEGATNSGVRNEVELVARVVTDDTDTFFRFTNIAQGGNDTRLHEYVDGVANELASVAVNLVGPPRTLKMVIATSAATTCAIDCTVWDGAEPGPQITFDSTINAALQQKQGYAGIWVSSGLNGTTAVVDDLAFTNDDGGAPANTRRYSLLTMGVG